MIDDDLSVRRSLMSLVRSLGHVVAGYQSADGFLAEDGLQQCDCIVTDIQMLGSDGIALKREVVRRGSSIPVIMLTARDDLALHARAKASGAFAVLRKPFDVNQFIDLLERALEVHFPAS
ncbi:response regulator transcription factor [Sphingomonas glacialis]|uniref:response regulator transcription factor n=1 Tax=Sphingomonas glacialis TaxID=658225 RepID=UPI0019D56E75|nr:response regulator [Sphingomonas glacialis]